MKAAKGIHHAKTYLLPAEVKSTAPRSVTTKQDEPDDIYNMVSSFVHGLESNMTYNVHMKRLDWGTIV